MGCFEQRGMVGIGRRGGGYLRMKNRERNFVMVQFTASGGAVCKM